MRSLFLTVAAAAGIVACSASPKQNAPNASTTVDPKSPANAPAVVSVPKNLPVLDTGGPAPVKTTIIPTDSIQRLLAVSGVYSLTSAMMVNLDTRSLVQMYSPSAVLHLPDSTISGGVAVARHLVSMARSKSLASFQRTSRGLRVLDDSTIADSGRYVMILKRSPKDSVIERGRYAATVRARSDINAWVILEDRLMPGSPATRKGVK